MDQKSIEDYRETLEGTFSVKHKCTPYAEKSRAHIHRQLEIIFPLTDNLTCSLNDTNIDLPARSFFLLNNSDLHVVSRRRESSHTGNLDRYVIYFSPEYLVDVLSADIDPLGCFYAMGEPSQHVIPLEEGQSVYVETLLERLVIRHERINCGAFGDALAQQLEFACLITLICQNYNKLYTLHGVGEEHKLAYEIIDYIHGHYVEPLSGETLARQFLIGKSQMYELFHRATGMTPRNLIIQCRIDKAAELLSRGCSVARAGDLVGYGNLSHFSQIFKQRMGCSPKQYQKRINGSIRSVNGIFSNHE